MLDHTVLAAKKKYRLQLIVIILKNNLLYNRALDLIQEFRNIKQNNYKSQETFEQHFLRKSCITPMWIPNHWGAVWISPLCWNTGLSSKDVSPRPHPLGVSIMLTGALNTKPIKDGRAQGNHKGPGSKMTVTENSPFPKCESHSASCLFSA